MFNKGPLPEQRLQEGDHALTQRLQVVAALQHRRQARLHREQHRGHLGIAVLRQRHPRQRVAVVPVEARRQQDHVGREAAQRRHHHLLEAQPVGVVAAALRQRDVDLAAPGQALAGDAGLAGARVEGRLMGADEEHVRVRQEDVLRAVAVVDVVVDDGHPRPLLAGGGGGDGHVVEQAEPHGLGPRGVVTRGTHRGEAVVLLRRQHLQRQIHRRARRVERRLIAARTVVGVRVQPPAGLGVGVPHPVFQPLQVRLGVDAQDLLPGGRPGRESAAVSAQLGGGDGGVDGDKPFGALGVLPDQAMPAKNRVGAQVGRHV